MLPRLLLPLLWLIGPFCHAAPWTSEIHPKSHGSFPSLPPTTLEYRVSWKGMLDAGSVRLEFDPKKHKKSGSYVVSSSSRSLGPASSLFPYESSFWSEINPSTLTAQRFFATEKDRHETIESITNFSKTKAEYTEITRDLKKGSIKTRSRTFPFTPVHDLFSAMLFVRSQQLQKGDRISLVAQPFATPYLIRIHVADHVVHQQQPAIHLRLSMNKINRDTLQLEPYKKMNREASLWLSNDQLRVPLELRASVFIGDIRATLKSKK
jgi:hypothetical protein